MKDHSRGFPPATRSDFVRWDAHVHHNACGGRVTQAAAWSGGSWSCAGCSAAWKATTINAFNADGLATRFHVRGSQPVDGEGVLVWKTEGKDRFTAVVPHAQAGDYERYGS